MNLFRDELCALKLRSARFYKPGPVQGRERTYRFAKGVQPVSERVRVPQCDYDGNHVIINFSEGVFGPISATAVKIKPRDGDKLERNWVDNGKEHRVKCDPFAFVDTVMLEKNYRDSIDASSVDPKFFRSFYGPEDGEKYEKAISRSQDEEEVSTQSTASYL